MLTTAPRTSASAHASNNKNDSFFKSRVQTKLAIGKPGDKYEVEADRTADTVLSKLKDRKPQAGADPAFFSPKPVVQPKKQETVQPKEETGKEEEIQEKPLSESITPLVQTSLIGGEDDSIHLSAGQEGEKCATCAANEKEAAASGNIQKKCSKCEQEEKTPVQTKCADCVAKEKETGGAIQQKCDRCAEKEQVQKKSEGIDSGQDISSQLRASKGGGSGMSDTTRQEMGESFGTDFSHVKIHTGASAVQMNKELGSHAFTNGSDIYFNEGKYNPGSDSGKHLLAHELTHTVQQGASPNKVQRKPEALVQKPKDTVVNQDHVPAAGPAELVEKERPVGASLAIAAPAETKAEASTVQEQVKKELPTDAKPPGTAGASVKEIGVAPSAISAETQKGNQVIESAAPNPGEVKDSKQQADAPGKSEKQAAGAAEKAQKESRAGNEKQDKKDKKEEKQGKVVDTAAAVSAEFHPLPPLTSLLQQPKEQEQKQPVAGNTAAAPVQMKQEISPDPKPKVEVTPEVFIARINTASQTNTAAVTTHADNLVADSNRKSEALKFSIYANIQNAILQTRSKFAQAKTDMEASVTAMEATMETSWSAKVKETTSEGETTKQAIRELFSNHLLNIDKAVTDNVKAAQDMQMHYREQVNTLVGEQISQAEKKRDGKMGSFPSDEKGQKQSAAVAEVANTTIQDMTSRKPSIVNAISEIIQPIPGEYTQKGTEAKSGVTDHQTGLLSDVDARVTEVVGQLNEIHQGGLKQLRSFKKDMYKELQDQESYTIQQLEGLLPGVDQQIATATKASIDGIETTKTQIIQQLATKSQEAIGIISGSANGDQASMDAFCTTMVTFLNGISTESMSLMTQGVQSMDEETQTISGNVDAGITATATSTDQMIAAFSQNVTTSLTSMETGYTQNMDTAFNALTKGFEELTGKIKGQFDTSIQKLTEGFTKTLNDAEVKILEAVNGGLAKNDEALAKLDGQMNEAAADAAWRYDNPIKATLLDIGSFVGGLIIGIVLVLALVVVFIVAFQLLLAGLVAMGISLAVAQMIVLVAGLALLAYGIYRNYSTRTANGQGGWESLGMAVLDVVGITSIYRGFTEKGLSPFERGFLIGEGIATIASFFLARKIDSAISSRMPASIANPGGVGVAGVRSPTGGGNSGGAKVIELFPRPRVTEPVPGSSGSGGGPSAVVTRGGALRKLAPAPEIAPVELPKPGIVIPFPRQNPVAATPVGGTPNPLIGTGASAGVNPATAPATRNRFQTCDDSLLTAMQLEKDAICNGIPKPGCSDALKKLQKGKELKGTSVVGLTRESIQIRIDHVKRCIKKREDIQETCFNIDPDPSDLEAVKKKEDHIKVIKELNDGIEACEELLRVADGLSAANKLKLLPANW